MNKRRLIRRVKYMFNISLVALMGLSAGLGYSLITDMYKVLHEESVAEPDPVITCDKKYYKAKFDCRKSIVDNHWEIWKQNKTIVRAYCDELAVKLYCSSDRI